MTVARLVFAALLLAACSDPADEDTSSVADSTSAVDDAGDDDDDDATGDDDDDDDDTGPDDDDDDDDDTGPDDDDDDDTTGTAGTTGDAPCEDNDDCPNPDAPFCLNTGTCGPCGDTASPDGSCLTEFPETPVCVDDECVECDAEDASACEDANEVCDDNTNECVPCTAHAQCAGPAGCDIPGGQCGDEANVWYVDGGHKICPTSGNGLSEDDPFCTLDEALGAVDALEDGTVATVYVAAMGAPYFETPVIESGQIVLLLASDADSPPNVQGSGSPTIRVQTGGTLVLDHITVSGNTGDEGISSTNALLHVEGSSISLNNGSGIVMNGGELTLINSFIASNGDNLSGTTALDLTSVNATVLYSSLVNNDGNGAQSLLCTDPGETELRNSIVTSADGDSIDCPGATIENNAVDSEIGGSNVDVGAVDGAWFVAAGSGDLHLTAAGTALFGDIAEWATDDPSSDIDGDLRPVINGSEDVAGADVPD